MEYSKLNGMVCETLSLEIRVGEYCAGPEGSNIVYADAAAAEADSDDAPSFTLDARLAN